MDLVDARVADERQPADDDRALALLLVRRALRYALAPDQSPRIRLLEGQLYHRGLVEAVAESGADRNVFRAARRSEPWILRFAPRLRRLRQIGDDGEGRAASASGRGRRGRVER